MTFKFNVGDYVLYKPTPYTVSSTEGVVQKITSTGPSYEPAYTVYWTNALFTGLCYEHQLTKLNYQGEANLSNIPSESKKSLFIKFPWMSALVTRFVSDIDDRSSDELIDASEIKESHQGYIIEADRANVITSEAKSGSNHLMLDLDDEDIYLASSSTPGHWHLAFPNPIEDADFDQLVTLLNKVGIIKRGNYLQYKTFGHLALRTPWVPKGMTKELHEAGDIGKKEDYPSDIAAMNDLKKACKYLGVEFPNEIYQQLNAKMTAQEVDIPDAPPVDWK